MSNDPDQHDPLGNDLRSAMSMCALLLTAARWRHKLHGDAWCMTAIYHDGRIQLTRERDGASMKFTAQDVVRFFERASDAALEPDPPQEGA